MATTVNSQLSRGDATTVDGRSPELTTDVDRALGLLRAAVAECDWNDEALAAHLSKATGKKYDRPLVWRVLNGHRPLSLEFLVALPNDVEACYEAKRAEQFGHVVVAPLEGPQAVKALVAGLVGVIGGLPARADRMARVNGAGKKSEVA